MSTNDATQSHGPPCAPFFSAFCWLQKIWRKTLLFFSNHTGRFTIEKTRRSIVKSEEIKRTCLFFSLVLVPYAEDLGSGAEAEADADAAVWLFFFARCHKGRQGEERQSGYQQRAEEETPISAGRLEMTQEPCSLGHLHCSWSLTFFITDSTCCAEKKRMNGK